MIIFKPELMSIDQLIYTIGDCALELSKKSPEQLAKASFQLERCFKQLDIIDALEYVEDSFALAKIKAQNFKARVSA